MLRHAARLLAAVLAAATAGGASLAVAASQPAGVARHGTEELVLMGTSPRSVTLSVIATGLFTDGGVISLSSGKARLGAGAFRIHTKTQPERDKLSRRTCLQTITARGSYTMNHGSGKYTRISGSGRFVLRHLAVYSRNANGECALSHPIATQFIITLRGAVTLGSSLQR
jgi:hypothetical protein